MAASKSCRPRRSRRPQLQEAHLAASPSLDHRVSTHVGGISVIVTFSEISSCAIVDGTSIVKDRSGDSARLMTMVMVGGFAGREESEGSGG